MRANIFWAEFYAVTKCKIVLKSRILSQIRFLPDFHIISFIWAHI